MQTTTANKVQINGSTVNIPRGYNVAYVYEIDYKGVLALVYPKRRVVIINAAARFGARIVQLCFGLKNEPEE